MKNWKTTLAGILAGTGVLLSGNCAGTEPLVGAIPQVAKDYAGVGLAVGLMVLGVVAKDSAKDVVPPTKVEEVKSEDKKG